jgi:hypothetical protein
MNPVLRHDRGRDPAPWSGGEDRGEDLRPGPVGHPPGLSTFWVDSALERLSGDHDNPEGHDRLKRPPT